MLIVFKDNLCHALNHNNFQPYTQIKYLICNSNVKHFCPNMTFRIFTLARRLPDGARMLIRIISWRSTIQNWRLKIEHVQRIKVDRDSSPNQVARRTLEHWAIWYLAMVDLVKVMLLGQLSPNLPACSQFTGLPACRRNAPTFKAEYSTRKFYPTLDLSLKKSIYTWGRTANMSVWKY